MADPEALSVWRAAVLLLSLNSHSYQTEFVPTRTLCTKTRAAEKRWLSMGLRRRLVAAESEAGTVAS